MNSRGQLASAMTWGLVATILVVLILWIGFLLMGYLAIIENNKSEISIKKNIPDIRISKTKYVIDIVDDHYLEISDWADKGKGVLESKKASLNKSIRQSIEDNNLDFDLTLVKFSGDEIDRNIVIGKSVYYVNTFRLLPNTENFNLLTKGGSFVNVYYR